MTTNYLLLHVKKCNLDLIIFLLDRDCNVNAQKSKGFIYSCKNGNIEIVKFLCEKNANIFAQNNLAIKKSIHNKKIFVTYFLTCQYLKYSRFTFLNKLFNCIFTDSHKFVSNTNTTLVNASNSIDVLNHIIYHCNKNNHFIKKISILWIVKKKNIELHRA